MKNAPKESLRSVFNFWVYRLRLRDWTISLRKASAKELGDCVATVDIKATFREATVNLKSLTEFDADLEEDLVHELLHIVFVQMSEITSSQAYTDKIFNEQGVNVVAHTLVALRRGLI